MIESNQKHSLLSVVKESGPILVLAVIAYTLLLVEVSVHEYMYVIVTILYVLFLMQLHRQLASGRLTRKVGLDNLRVLKTLAPFIIIFLYFIYFSKESLASNCVVISLLVLAYYVPKNIISTASKNKLKDTDMKPDKHIRYTLVAGVGNVAESVERHLFRDHTSHHQIKGYINCKKKEKRLVPVEKVVSDLEHIHQYLSDNPVDEIVIALPIKTSKKIKNILAAADYHGVRVKYIPDYQQLFGNNYKMVRYGELDAINVRQLPLDETFYFHLKNSFDVLFSAVALLLLAPLFLLIAFMIKLDSAGPVFYCPIRIGRAGKPFRVFKFRSMLESDTTAGGVFSTTQNDPRITKVGKFLRKYSLDELPQFLNVFIGDMSVVGPRPHRSFLNQQLQASVDKYMIRHYFKPGITGWAQVNGWRGPTETAEQKSQRTHHDLWYMENWSLWLDLKIIFLTIFSKKAHKHVF